MMNWINIWMKLFGTTEWLGLDMGFWASMGVVTLLVVLMNVVFWFMKPKAKGTSESNSVNNNLLM